MATERHLDKDLLQLLLETGVCAPTPSASSPPRNAMRCRIGSLQRCSGSALGPDSSSATPIPVVVAGALARMGDFRRRSSPISKLLPARLARPPARVELRSQRADLAGLADKTSVGGAVISNFSVGMVLLQQAAAARFYDCAELTELHHNRKADAPSGTCIKTAELMEELGKAFNHQQVEDTKPCPAALVAHHEVMFGLERLL